MSKSGIVVSLGTLEIEKVISELAAYKRETARKCELFKQRVAELLESEIRAGFAKTFAEEYWIMGYPNDIRREPTQVTVSTISNGDTLLVCAYGEDAVWVEFGTGVFYNTPVGSSPNPLVAENGLPFTIGSYGFGLGQYNTWSFNYLNETHGIPAQMPMYNAIQAISMDIVQIAREVFK